MVSFTQLTAASVAVTFDAVDAFGNTIETIDGNPCSYYQHERLVYQIGIHRLDEATSRHSVQQTIEASFQPGLLLFELSIDAPDPSQQYVLNYTMYQGLLLEDGLDVKFYATDNFQQFDVEEGLGFGTPQDVGRLTQSLIAAESDSPEWFTYHKERDRFSVKISTLAKPLYSETYFFSISSALVKNTEERKSGVEVWIDDHLVIADGQTTGSLLLSRHSWCHIKVLYRVTKNPGGVSVPQFFLNLQSASQMISTLTSSGSGQIVALDPEEHSITDEVVFAADSVQLPQS